MFPLSGLVLGAFRAMVVLELESVVLDLESEVFLEASLELAFPVSPSSIWGDREKAWGLLFCRAQAGGGVLIGLHVLREKLGGVQGGPAAPFRVGECQHSPLRSSKVSESLSLSHSATAAAQAAAAKAAKYGKCPGPAYSHAQGSVLPP